MKSQFLIRESKVYSRFVYNIVNNTLDFIKFKLFGVKLKYVFLLHFKPKNFRFKKSAGLDRSFGNNPSLNQLLKYKLWKWTKLKMILGIFLDDF